MWKNFNDLDNYVLKYIDRIVIDIQAYEEYNLLLDINDPFYRLYQNANLTYFVIALRGLVDKKDQQKSSIYLFIEEFKDDVIKYNPIWANERYIQKLNADMQSIREISSINKYFAHVNTVYLSEIITWKEELPEITEIIKYLKSIIGDFTKLIYGSNWILQKRHSKNIWII